MNASETHQMQSLKDVTRQALRLTRSINADIYTLLAAFRMLSNTQTVVFDEW